MDAQTPTALESLFTGISTNITNMMTSLTSVSNGLVSNPIFQLTIGIAALSIIFGLLFVLVRKMRNGGK